MRSLASQGLRALCSLDLENLGQEVMARIVSHRATALLFTSLSLAGRRHY